jgi:lipoprotein-releasing system permease protein
MKRLEWRIAIRYLRSRRSSRLVSLITFIATGGVTVGVMALVVVMGVMNGLQQELRDRILVASPHVRILTFGETLRMDEWREALPVIRAHPEVEAAAPFVLTQGIVSNPSGWQEGVMVVGLPSDTGSASVTTLPEHFLSGDLNFRVEASDVEGGVVLGRRLADRLSAHRGSRLNFVSASGLRYNRAIGGYIPRFLPFEMTGDFETRMYEYDNSYVVMSIRSAQEFAGLDSAVSGIEVRVTDPLTADEVGRQLVAELGDFHYRFIDWQTQNGNLFAALRLEKLAMSLILLLIVLVAAFNIVSTLTMVVADKTREIGILRAMGLPAKAVRTVFVLQGAIIGLLGTVLGGVLGLVVAKVVDSNALISIPAEVYFIDHLPVRVNLTDFLVVVVASFVVATIATVYPARQAAGFVPVEAIRHE